MEKEVWLACADGNKKKRQKYDKLKAAMGFRKEQWNNEAIPKWKRFRTSDKLELKTIPNGDSLKSTSRTKE